MRIILSLFLLFAAILPAAAVIDGTPEEGHLSHSMVMILKEGGGLCSGVVIAQNTILTAAHCVTKTATEVRVHYRDLHDKPILLTPRRVRIHPQYIPDAIETRRKTIDLAVVELAQLLPAAFKPMPLATTTAAHGDEVQLLGFGLTNERNPDTGGSLLSTRLRLIEPYGKSALLLWARGFKPAPEGDTTTSKTASKLNIRRGACGGDSGGALVSEAGQLIAITTWSTGIHKAACGDLTQGVWIAPHLAFIEGRE
jgi:hypothetical protein